MEAPSVEKKEQQDVHHVFGVGDYASVFGGKDTSDQFDVAEMMDVPLTVEPYRPPVS